MNERVRRQIERDISASRDEFLRGLRAAFPQTLEETADGFRARGDDAAMEIRLVETAPLSIALLTLPRLAVSIRFIAGDDAACSGLLAHLDRYLHRGGG